LKVKGIFDLIASFAIGRPMKEAVELLEIHLYDTCSEIHTGRLNSLLEVASALHKSSDLSLTAMGRKLSGKSDIKHKIKKIDRLEGNKHLYEEFEYLYKGLSDYVFTYISHDTQTPIVVDLCYMKDNREIQMLSAEVATKGRSVPLYREVFNKGELKDRAEGFLSSLSNCIPSDRDVLIIMDAGFGEDWFKAIENNGWYWLSRIRQGKKVKLSDSHDWTSIKDLIPQIGVRAKNHPNAYIMIKHNRLCRLVTKKNPHKNVKANNVRQPRNYHAGNGDYQRSAKEPWILATNLPANIETTKVINYYKKRMQIEESFRDVKSHQFGLSARYARTKNIYRWGVKMLLAAIVQIACWIVGIVGHSQGFQRRFQANTVRDKKVFSYFYLGQLIIEHNVLGELEFDIKNLDKIVDAELARQW
jgi:hypothetical protein